LKYRLSSGRSKQYRAFLLYARINSHPRLFHENFSDEKYGKSKLASHTIVWISYRSNWDTFLSRHVKRTSKFIFPSIEFETGILTRSQTKRHEYFDISITNPIKVHLQVHFQQDNGIFITEILSEVYDTNDVLGVGSTPVFSRLVVLILTDFMFCIIC
jgi:hypothetical protein